MPTQTDRDKVKDQQEGEFLTAKDIVSAKTAVQDMHSRTACAHRKMGAENAATNVAELPIGFVPVKSKPRKIGIRVVTNIAADNSHYAVIHFYGRKAGTSTLVGSWNTHGGAQGALTTAGPAVISTAATGLITNAQSEIAADSDFTFDIQKVGNGQDVAAGSIFSAWLEEI